MDHKNLSEDIPYFQENVGQVYKSFQPSIILLHIFSTAENIAVFVWEQMKTALGEKARLLYEVAIDETDNNTFVYRGEIN